MTRDGGEDVANDPSAPGISSELTNREAEEVLRRLAGQFAAADNASSPRPALAQSSVLATRDAAQGSPPATLSHEALRALIEAVPDALIVVDVLGRMILVNAQTEALFGYRRDELLGRPVELLVPDRDRDRHVGLRDSYFANPHVRPMARGLELSGRRKDGHEVPVEIGLSPLSTDAGPQVVASIRDVSERRRAEAQLRKLEDRYRTLVEGIPAVTFMAAMDEEANELYVSPQVEQLLGFSQKEWVENPILWFTQLHPEDQARWHEEFARTVATGERFQSVYRFIARDGREVWVHGEAQMVRDKSGRPLFLQGVAFDITGIKEAEKELKALNATLEERVAERTVEAEERATELGRSNRDLELFAGVAAHDLRAPLRTLTSQLLELDKKYGDQIDPGDREAHILHSQKCAEDMRALIDGLFEFSRVRTEGKDPAPVSCSDAAATACDLLEDAIHQSRAVVEWGELPVVLADKSQIERLFQNLISNSLKFRVDERAPHVLISARWDGGMWTIAVKDNGIGIEGLRGLKRVKDPLEKIFDLGIQSRQHTGKKFGDKYSGSGIGLATCKNIVERHGGHIQATSDGLGQGTTISFTLPAAD